MDKKDQNQDRYRESFEGDLGQEPQIEKEISVEETPEIKKREFLESERKIEREKEVKAKLSTVKSTVQQGKQPIQSSEDINKNNQVDRLCNLAFEKGLDEAIKAAKQLNDAYILDEFHDALIDQFYKKLIEQKKLKKL